MKWVREEGVLGRGGGVGGWGGDALFEGVKFM